MKTVRWAALLGTVVLSSCASSGFMDWMNQHCYDGTANCNLLERQLWVRGGGGMDAMGQERPRWSSKNGLLLTGLGTEYESQGVPWPYDDARADLTILSPLTTEQQPATIYVRIDDDMPPLEDAALARVDTLPPHSVRVDRYGATLFWPGGLTLADFQDFRDELRNGSFLVVAFEPRVRVPTIYFKVDLEGFDVEETAACAPAP